MGKALRALTFAEDNRKGMPPKGIGADWLPSFQDGGRFVR